MSRLSLMLAACCTAAAFAQSPAADSQSVLEVATVRQNVGPPGNQSLFIRPGGSVVATNFPLINVIGVALGDQLSQLDGGPAWLRDARYDILAKSSTVDASLQSMRNTLKALLTERFKLRTHVEQREMPVYALVLARRDGQLGPRMSPAAPGCGAPPSADSPASTPPRCNLVTPRGRIVGTGIPLRILAAEIGPRLGRVVVDKTGLQGWFDIELEFTTEQAGITEAAGVPLVTALQEQLGLRVEADRAPVDVTVIDSLEWPTEN